MRLHAILSPAAGFGLALLAAAGRLAAVPLALPNELPLDALPLTLELSHADLGMIVGDGAGHLLRARRTRPADGEAGDPATLEVIRDAAGITIRRSDETGGEVPRLRLDLVVAAGQEVRLAGSDLVVRIEDIPTESAAEPRAPALFRLRVESSEATLAGVQGSILDLEASSVWLDGSGGSLFLTLDGGMAEVRGHRGEVTLDAAGAEIIVRDLEGTLAPRLRGGRLTVAGGEGTLVGTAEAAVLRFDDWRGAAELRGTDSAIEASAPQGGAARWRFEGKDLRLVLEQLRGGVEARIRGGSLLASDLRGDVEATADAGARLELSRMEGSIGLHLTGRSEARLSEVKGGLAAEITDSRLEAEGIDQLRLKAVRAEVSGRRLARLDAFEASDSELELDLREILHDPSLRLEGTGHARVWLATPCAVQVSGPEGLVGSAIEVTNCELRLPGQRITRRQDRFQYGANPPTVLNVAMSPDIELEVEGDP